MAGRRDRAQSTLIGFLFVVGIVVAVFSLYQAVIVPQENAEVEFRHAQTIEGRMGDLQSRILLVGATGGSQSVTMDLGPDYPPRALAINPAPPAGRLHTRTGGTISVFVGGDALNLTSVCGYGGASVETRAVSYEVDYNEHGADPTLVYEHTALYRESDDGHVLLSEHQSLVVGDTITLVPVASSVSQASTGSATLRVVGGPVNRTVVTDDRVRISMPSGLPAATWERLLADQPRVQRVEQTDERVVDVVLEAGNYTLACYGVGLNGAPPSGARVLHGPDGGTTATHTPPSEAPSPSIEAVSIQQNVRGGDEVTVDWAATDAQGNLDTVVVRVTDLKTDEAAETTDDVSGGNASGTFQHVFGRGDEPAGDTYRVIVFAQDTEGNEARVEEDHSV